MANYKVCVEIINILDINADSAEKAVELVRNNLINQKQIKPCDPVNIYIVEEITLESEEIKSE